MREADTTTARAASVPAAGGDLSFSYSGKRALVTGAGRGIGRAIALAFAQKGADLSLTARSKSELEEVASQARALDRKVWVHQADLSKPEEALYVVKWAIQAMGGLDIFVNNAGGGMSLRGGSGELLGATPEAFDYIFNLNLRAPTFMTIETCKQMVKQEGGGAILNITSIDGLFPAPGEALYGAAKSAIVSLTQTLGYEFGQYGIRVNAVAAGLTRTKMTESLLRTADQQLDRASFYPLGRLGTPDDIANAAVYLCSSEASWVSGAVLVITGGQLATTDAFRWVREHNPVPATTRI